ncbi:hypothetical protein GW17_00048020 [Ensete ventricosum]|nr:hypothetical protein GW17_00048020 [Ensete ventricosum]
MMVHRMAKGYYGSKFATEVAPPALVSVKAAKVLDTIDEEEEEEEEEEELELALMEDLSGTWGDHSCWNRQRRICEPMNVVL